MNTMLRELIGIAAEIHKTKYPQAKAIFLAGSLIRGEGTSTSDLDLVIVFDSLRCAYRESFAHGKWPVEAFVHDPQTLEYFFRQIDCPTGFPSLPTMVAEGVEVPEANGLTGSLKQLANSVLNEGPPKWTETDLNNSRYAITNLIDDLRDPRSRHEMHATATLLYSALANHYFRSKNIWSANGKAIPGRLHAIDTSFAKKFLESFENVFVNNCSKKVISVAAEILENSGGFLFDGYKQEAPESWRIG